MEPRSIYWRILRLRLSCDYHANGDPKCWWPIVKEIVSARVCWPSVLARPLLNFHSRAIFRTERSTAGRADLGCLVLIGNADGMSMPMLRASVARDDARWSDHALDATLIRERLVYCRKSRSREHREELLLQDVNEKSARLFPRDDFTDTFVRV